MWEVVTAYAARGRRLGHDIGDVAGAEHRAVLHAQVPLEVVGASQHYRTQRALVLLGIMRLHVLFNVAHHFPTYVARHRQTVRLIILRQLIVTIH